MSVRKRIQADDPEAQHMQEVAALKELNWNRQRELILAFLPRLVAAIEQRAGPPERLLWSVALHGIWSAAPEADVIQEHESNSWQEAARFGELGQRKFMSFDPRIELCVVFCFPDAIARTARGAEVPTYDQFWVINRQASSDASH